MLKFVPLDEGELDGVVKKYIEFYNDVQEGCWTYEKAHKRIHQVMTTEDSMGLVAYNENGESVAFAMGYYKVYDDLTAYFLEEIVVFDGHQNKGYGSQMLAELERIVKENGAEHMEFICVNDEHHLHFYGKAGFYSAGNLVMMGKHWKV